MADNSRIDDLRRRVQKDPASIAFAQLAEECRRAGQHQEAVDVCRSGLDIHPAYLSARVTLGRALVELNLLDEAQTELEFVLKSAPENLAAIRGLAEIHHRRGSLPDALAQYRAALLLARNDPDLQRTVAELERVVEPPKPLASDDGLSFEQMQSEFLKDLPPPPPAPIAPPPVELDPVVPAIEEEVAALEGPPYSEELAEDQAPLPVEVALRESPYTWEPPPPEDAPPEYENPWPVQSVEDTHEREHAAEPPPPEDAPPIQENPWPVQSVEDTDERERATKTAMETIVALEQFLDAIHVPRTQSGA